MDTYQNPETMNVSQRPVRPVRPVRPDVFGSLEVVARPGRKTNITDIRNYHAARGAIFRGERTAYFERYADLGRHNEHFRRHRTRKHLEPKKEKYPRNRTYSSRPISARDVTAGIVGKKWKGLDFTFEKIIGAGGFGSASLWNVNFKDGSGRKVVIKRGVQDDYNVAEELSWHKRYHGNPHVVRAVDLAEEAAFINRGQRELTGRTFDPQRRNLLVLEHAQYGDLLDILIKISRQGEGFNIPEKVLWEIWECLVLGVAAIAYQPTLNQQDVKVSFEEQLRRADLKGEKSLDEFLAELDSWKITHDVHMDLEEKNILAGAHPSHNGPILKMHDFADAWCHKMDECWAVWSHEDYWAKRSCPKSYRLTPEQYTRDWDGLDVSAVRGERQFAGPDLNKPGTQPVAGRYGVWTNIFRIGSIMESVIRNVYFQRPFTPGPHTFRDEIQRQTYGWRLFEGTPRAGPILLDTVAKCQAERPIDRPTIVELLNNIRYRKRVGFTNSNVLIMAWWQTLLRPQPPVPVSTQASVTQGGIGGGPPPSWAGRANRIVVIGSDAGSSEGELSEGVESDASPVEAVSTEASSLSSPEQREVDGEAAQRPKKVRFEDVGSDEESDFLPHAFAHVSKEEPPIKSSKRRSKNPSSKKSPSSKTGGIKKGSPEKKFSKAKSFKEDRRPGSVEAFIKDNLESMPLAVRNLVLRGDALEKYLARKSAEEDAEMEDDKMDERKMDH